MSPGPLLRLTVLLAAATFAASAPAAAPAPSELHLGAPGEPLTLDPHRYNLRLEETLLADLFLGLTTMDAAGRIVPGAARRWSVSEDGLRWTFELRDDLFWSDGTPLRAADFAYGFRRLLAPETAASLAYFLYPVKNAEAVNAGTLPGEQLGVSAAGPTTLIIDLEAPYPHLAERLLYPTGYPVPAHVIERVGDDWVKPEHWVSNGAYVLDDWQPQRHVALRTNPHFFAPPAIDRVYYHPLASEQNAYNRYRSGDLHAISSFPASELTSVRADLADHLRESPLQSIIYLVFNVRRPPFDDARVREALSLVIDPAVLTDRVQRAGNLPSRSFVPDMITGYESYEPDFHEQPMPERVARARRLMAQAGFGPDRPLDITLRYISGAAAKRTSLAIASFWKPLHVRTTLHQAELKVHFADLRQGEFDVAQAGWIGENNAEHYLGLLVSDTGAVNYGAFADPAYDALVARARLEARVPARNALLREAEAQAMRQHPVVPLWSVGVRRLVDPKLQGWQENPRDAHPARYLSW